MTAHEVGRVPFVHTDYLSPHGHGSIPNRVLMFSPDGFGLGHIRRTLAIASAVDAAHPGTAILALSSSNLVGAYDHPATFDYIKLPSVTKDPSGAYASHRLPISFNRSLRIRERLIFETAEAFQPEVIVVDHAPLGLRGELRQTLARVRSSSPQTRIILGMRDIIDEPEAVRSAWIADGVYTAFEDFYDDILIYGSPDVFDPIAEYGLSPSVASRATYCGYIRKPEPLHSAAAIRESLDANDRPLVVVTTGGGGDGGKILTTYLDMLERHDMGDLVSCIIPGPLARAEEVQAIAARAETLPNVSVISFTPHLTSYLNAADLVISMGGYNTMTETAYLGKRSIVIPRVHPRREQAIRAERFAAQGLATSVSLESLTASSFFSALVESLEQPEPIVTLPFTGLARACDVILDGFGSSTSLGAHGIVAGD